MKVILLQQIPKVGKKGEVVEVSDGYAANALFPNKKAIPATSKNLEALNRKNQSEKDLKALEKDLLDKAILAIPNETIIIQVSANEKGHLFSKLGPSDVVKELEKYRISVSNKSIIMDQIKEIGDYKILVKDGEYKKEINISVVSK